MRRRLLAALAALLLAATGAVVLLAYVRGADARALAGVETLDVLVVDQPVAEGTPGEDLAGLVRTERLPAKAVVPGGIADLGELAGQVATSDLQPGEQLLAARFAAPADLTVPGTVAPPEGASEVSILLEPQRAVGGRLAAGDTVGVHVSLDEELVPERLRERHRTGLARYRETGHGPYVDSHELLELPAIRTTGEEIRIEMSLNPIGPIHGVGDEERRYALAIVRDITERKRTEGALRESEARFHALVLNALDIVMVTDA